MTARDFFTSEEKTEIETAITKAEEITSGEIRIHLENTCKENILDHAAWIFEELEMHTTQLRSGVLIYLAVNDQKFAILGDTGINEKLGENYWEKLKNDMASDFKAGKFKEGLIHAVSQIGQDLTTHFPKTSEDQNELLNDISFGEDEKA